MRKWVVGIAVMAGVGLAGCQRHSGPSATHVLTKMSAAAAAVDSGTIQAHQTVKASGETVTNRTKMQFSTDPTVLHATVAIGAPKVKTQTIALYQTQATAYVQTAGKWYKQNTADLGVNVKAIQQTMTTKAFTQAAAKAKGKVTTKGHTYVVTVSGHGKALRPLVKQVLRYGSADNTQVAAQVKASKIKAVTYTVTVAKKTFLPKRVHLSMTLTTNGTKLVETATQTYTQLNAGHTVTIPAAVRQQATTATTDR
ncbi:DUF6612 family protein [Lacticaseibacillus nasuensis]|uniref:DUF6612 family protein n=1 Tax=Lacticaseibacillus nasuensis TaxID=944671 RepID=UPI002246B0E7|nr:DUF6612 family protein [Lacticaseibacillus nasuensis]MCX2455861.1 hypothetical protein [Lacticaseibacillus nasuensis]